VSGGGLADRWLRRSQRGQIYVSAIGMSFIAPAIFDFALFGLGNDGSLAVAVASLILFGLGWGYLDCNNMPILSQILRTQLRATGYGIMNFVSISCGGLTDWGFGILRERQTPLNAIFRVLPSFRSYWSS
jgi:hypothetical protein